MTLFVLLPQACSNMTCISGPARIVSGHTNLRTIVDCLEYSFECALFSIDDCRKRKTATKYKKFLIILTNK